MCICIRVRTAVALLPTVTSSYFHLCYSVMPLLLLWDVICDVHGIVGSAFFSCMSIRWARAAIAQGVGIVW